MEKILVSACLIGINCRYSGDSSLDEKLLKIAENAVLIPVCPEQLGGMKTPRNPAEFKKGNGKEILSGEKNIVDTKGNNVSEFFLKGAEEVLKIVKLLNIKKAILKERSPSCGSNFVYLNGKVVEGKGVTATLLSQNGIEILSEKETVMDGITVYK